MLSIPFSLLHNLPRLSGLVNSSDYQSHLIAMSTEITTLWAWDPDAPSSNTSVVASNQRKPRPRPIHDDSRQNVTFANMRPSRVAQNSQLVGTTTNSAQFSCISQADTGAYTIGIRPVVHFEDGILKTVPMDLNMNQEEEKFQCQIYTHAATSSFHRSASYLESTESTDSSDDSNNLKPDLVSLQGSIMAWLKEVEKEIPDPPPVDLDFDPDRFTPGVMGGMTTNDILMIKGLINPLDYVRFHDLCLFS
jgi:hypothetical protein